MRLVIGFSAGALSHLIFQGTLGLVLYATHLAPGLVWSLKPVGPFALPITFNNMFWDGLWGIVYALLEPRLTRRFGLVPGGLLFGFGPLLVFWFVVLPLKGAGIGGGFEAAATLRTIALDLVFGMGMAVTFRSLARLALVERRAPEPGGPSAY